MLGFKGIQRALAVAGTLVLATAVGQTQVEFDAAQAAGRGAAGAVQVAPGASADYRALTNNLSDVANLNVETRRGLLIWGANEELWALNTHASTLNLYALSQSTPLARYRTLLNPVSLAAFDDDILVLGAGTRALARHDRSSGQILSLVDLPSEPFDLVVDEGAGRAWVSCMGNGVVVEIDLFAMTLEREFSMPGRRAACLHLDGGELFCAPQLSGNNSLVIGQPKSAQIVDGEDLIAFPGGGLPDTDLVSINTQTGALTVWGTDQGTLLLDHGRNPVTGAYWMLNTESLNKDPALQTEPDLKGRFVENRVSITDLQGATTLPARPDLVVSLDVELPAGLLPVSLPTDLEFDPVTGAAWVTSPTNDVVAYLAPDGSRQPSLDLQLPAGSIPRSFVRDPFGARGLVYAWGANVIYVVSLQGENYNQIVFQFDLGHDPLPEFIRRGREIFYDAHNSENARTTCAHCHPGGGADALAWSIPDSPIDEKGVMVTQSLIGIADTFPHHWRGERDLVDFNVAFRGLLGGQELDPTPGAELDQFVAFVHSLTSHANPNQDVTRRVVDAATPDPIGGVPGFAVRGQALYNDKPSDSATATCTTCHFNPTGSAGDVFDDIEAALAPAQVNFEVAHFGNTLTFKDQPLVTVLTEDGSCEVQELGFGWGHNGTIPDLFGFLQTFALLTSAEQRDVTAFLRQFDTGLSPAAQQAYRLTDDSQAVHDVLLPQAESHWIDIVAFGTDELSGAPLASSWFYDSAQELFLSDDPGRSSVDFDTLAGAAAGGQADLVVLGVPPGNGRRLGLDWDADGLENGAEATHGTDPYEPDADSDGFPDGYEVLHGSDPLVGTSVPGDVDPPVITSLELDFVNARLAKFRWTTDEPSTARLTYSTGLEPGYIWQDPTFAIQHTSVLTFDESSALVPNVFTISARLTDLSGNQASFPFATFDAGQMLNPFSLRLIRAHDLAVLDQTSLPGGILDARVEVFARYKESQPPYTPAENVVVIAQVLVEDAANERFTIASPQTALPASFIVDPDGLEVWDNLPGPFLVLPPTDGLGRTEASFSLTGLTPGQRVKFNIIAIEPAGIDYDPSQPIFLVGSLSDYSLPTTQPANRCVELVY